MFGLGAVRDTFGEIEMADRTIQNEGRSHTKARILVVEDEKVTAMDIHESLQSLGYTVLAVASSGEEAIQKAAETHPDLVLMDIKLVGCMNGVQAAHHLRTRFNIPVIYQTAFSDDKMLQQAKLTEPYGYLIKPFDERELHATIEMALYKHKMEKKLRESEQWFATTLRDIGDAVIATDSQERITFMNPVAETLTGWKLEDAVGKDLNQVFQIIHEETRCLLESPVAKALREGVVVHQAGQTILMARDGTETPIDDNAAPIRDDQGNIMGVVLTFRDISERWQTEAALRILSHTDDLTGLYNRRGFLTLAQQNLKLAIRNRVGLLLLIIDVDNLKQINDSFGHPEGDRALISTAEILKATFRASEVLARLGGDEFIVLALDITHQSVDRITARLQETLKHHNEQTNGRYQLSFSTGIARFDPNQASSIDELITKADETMYAHKESKRRGHSG